MTRRSIFRILASAIVASSVEVMGWRLDASYYGILDRLYRRLIADANAAYENAEYEEVIWWTNTDLGLINTNMELINANMPRWDYKDGEWIWRPHFNNEP